MTDARDRDKGAFRCPGCGRTHESGEALDRHLADTPLCRGSAEIALIAVGLPPGEAVRTTVPKRRARRRYFTLIDLGALAAALVVIALVAVMSWLGGTIHTQEREDARQERMVANVRRIETVLHRTQWRLAAAQAEAAMWRACCERWRNGYRGMSIDLREAHIEGPLQIRLQAAPGDIPAVTAAVCRGEVIR